MKSGWVIAVCAGLAVLVLAVRFASRDAGESPPGAGEIQTRAEDRAMGARRAGPDDQSPPARVGGFPPRPGGTDGRSADRFLPSVAEARRDLISRRDARAAETELAERAAGAPGGAGARAAAGGERQAAELPPADPDVVYDGGGAIFDTLSRVTVGQMDSLEPAGGTMSFWVKPEWESGDPDHATFVQLGERGLRVVKDGRNLRFEYTNVDGDNELGGIADASQWSAGDWRHVTATWEAGTLSLYVDGRQIFVNAPEVPPLWDAAPWLYVGSVPPKNGRVPPAQITQVIVLTRVLGGDEVRSQFASSRPPAR